MPSLPTLQELGRERQSGGLLALVGEFGQDFVIHQLGWPAPESWAAQVLLQRQPRAPAQALDSLPFASLCRGLLAPLMALSVRQQQRLFGFSLKNWERETRQAKLQECFARDLGLTAVEKVCWLTGERFGSVRSWSEERLLQILAHSYLLSLSQLRQQMIEKGGVAALAASLGPASGEPLASRVVTLCLLQPPDRRHPCWPQLLKRCSPLERYVLVSRLAGKLDLAWGQRQDSLQEVIARHFGVAPETLSAAHALEDLSRLVERLEQGGPEALREVILRPLAAFRPALALSAQSDSLEFPCWVECKYDGIRLLLHKERDGLGNLRLAAYTRRRNDWSEMIPGLEGLLSGLWPASLILDGELHGRVLSPDGLSRPANVYEVHECLRGEIRIPLRYVAFDLLYCNGQDLTSLPFQERRRQLEALLKLKTPAGLPLEISQGSLVQSREEVQRLYQQFRRQGHEGCMIKDPKAPYPLAQRSPAWQKKKPLDSVDLVLTAAYWGEASRPGARVFDSYQLSARHSSGWREVGTVAGVDQALTRQLVSEVWSQQLLTGQDCVHESARGVAHGVQLRPALVVTVAYEDILWDRNSQQISLRSPRIQGLRSSELPLNETTAWEELEQRALKSRLG